VFRGLACAGSLTTLAFSYLEKVMGIQTQCLFYKRAMDDILGVIVVHPHNNDYKDIFIRFQAEYKIDEPLFSKSVPYCDMNLRLVKRVDGFTVRSSHEFWPEKLPLWPSIQSPLKMAQIQNVYTSLMLNVFKRSVPSSNAHDSMDFLVSWMRRKGFDMEFIMNCQVCAHNKSTQAESKQSTKTGGAKGTRHASTFLPALVLPLGLQPQLVKHHVDLQLAKCVCTAQTFTANHGK